MDIYQTNLLLYTPIEDKYHVIFTMTSLTDYDSHKDIRPSTHALKWLCDIVSNPFCGKWFLLH